MPAADSRPWNAVALLTQTSSAGGAASCVPANVHNLAWHEDEVVADFEIGGAHSPACKIVRITVLRKANVARQPSVIVSEKRHRHAEDVAAL